MTAPTSSINIFDRCNSKPKCFDTREQFVDWRKLVKLSGETCFVCDDCTETFKKRMQAERRCDEVEWRSIKFSGGKGWVRRAALVTTPVAVGGAN